MPLETDAPDPQDAPTPKNDDAPPPSGGQQGGNKDTGGKDAPADPGKPPAPAPKPAAKGTLLDEDPEPGDKEPPDPAPDTLPENWRDLVAAGDKKIAERLKRFKSAADLVKSFLAAEQKISSGEYRKPLPDKPTDEEIAEYRKAHGIPDKPEDYKIELPEGFEPTKEDKALMSEFLAVAHETHMAPREVNGAVGWFFKRAQAMQEAAEEAAAEVDREYHKAGETALRADWGPDYKTNLRALSNFLDGMPDGIGDLIISARDGEGRRLLNNPIVAQWLTDMALDDNPAATFKGGDGTMKGMTSRKAEIQKVMKEDMAAYWKDKDMQREMAEILEAEERMAARGKKPE